MSTRIIIGGEKNSGKSSYALSLVKRLVSGLGLTACSVELDVWSNSYPAFAGGVAFETRPKRTGLDWDWKTPLDERLRQFNLAQEDFIFGDLPGARIDEATEYMLTHARADGAMIISRTPEGIAEWRQFFEKYRLDIIVTAMSVQGEPPTIVRDMSRRVDHSHPDVAALAEALLGKFLPKG